MKLEQKLKIAFLILLIVLISLISFFGIWIQNKGLMQNLINDYILGRDLQGGRSITLEVVEKENKSDEETEKVELTKEDYKLAKDIIQKRLENMAVEDYTISVNEKTGLINIDLPENENTDYIIQFSTLNGKFTVEDEEGNELLNNSNVKMVKTMYGQVSTSTEQGVKVFLRIQFNDDCIDKLKEISTTYVSSKDEEGNDTSKAVVIKLDGSTLSTTSFEKEITNGQIELAVGSTTNSSSDLQTYLQQASYLEKILNLGKLPADYVLSDITKNMQTIAIIVIAIIILAIIVLFIVKYKKLGVIVSISSIGFIATLLLVIRYTNVVITINGVIGIVVATITNYFLNMYILKYLTSLDDTKAEIESNINKGFLKGLWSVVPILIISLILCFSKWLSVYSFGMITFWGIIIMIIYNLLITKNLLMSFRKA